MTTKRTALFFLVEAEALAIVNPDMGPAMRINPRRRHDFALLQASIIAVGVYDWKRGSGPRRIRPGRKP
jgi:hypothetical protein